MSLEDTYYIKPTTDSYSADMCPAEYPCLLLEEINDYATTGSTFELLEGNYTLQRTLVLRSVSNIIIRGEGNTISVNYLWTSPRPAIYCYNATNVTIEGLSFKPNVNGLNRGEEIGAVEIFFSRGIFISNSLFEGFGALQKGYLQALYIANTNITISNCHFRGNTAHKGGAVYAIDGSDVILVDNIFTDNKALTSGGAINAENQTTIAVRGSLGNVFVYNFGRASGGAIGSTASTLVLKGNTSFENNYCSISDVTSTGGAVRIKGGMLLVSNRVYFFNNTAVEAGAISIGSSIVDIFGTEIVFRENLAYYHHGGAINIYSSSGIINATFFNNSAELSGGAVYVRGDKSSLQLSGIITANNAITLCGGAVFVSHANNITFKDIKVTKNTNSAICIHKSKIRFSGMSQIVGNSGATGGALYLSYGTVLFGGTTSFENNSADASGGAIYALSTNMTFSDTMIFTANSAENGGAMFFKTLSFLTLEEHTKVSFSYNHASKYGGGIFHEDTITPSQCQYTTKSAYLELPKCFIQLNIPLSLGSIATLHIELSSNLDTAGKDGSFMYGGLLDRCRLHEESNRINTYDNFGKIVSIEVLKRRGVFRVTQQNTTAEAISSEPYELCFCNHDVVNCTEVLRKEVHRGETFTVPLIATTQGGSSSTLITAVNSRTSSLKLGQGSQNLPRHCSGLAYNVFSTESYEELTLYPNGPCRDTGSATAVIAITLLPCPSAFMQYGEKCVCEERLQTYNANCDIDEDIRITVPARSKFWLGVLYGQNESYEGLILFETCPAEYCRTETVSITLENLNIQCNHNREGVLCGACALNYSSMFGSARCGKCSNTYLALLLPFAAAGIALVVFLSVLRLTVASGMINGIILYANIVQVNKSLFFPGEKNFLTIFIALTLVLRRVFTAE